MFKDPSVATLLAAVPLMLLLYPILPIVLAWFYRSRDVTQTFETADAQPHWTDPLPLPILVLCMLYTFFILVIHTAVLFRGAFPLFGVLVTDLRGFELIAGAMAVLVLLTWGTIKRQLWACWGGLAYFVAAIVSLLLTFSRLSWAELLSAMAFPPLETQALSGIAASGWHIVAFLAPPLLATLGVILAARRHFGAPGQQDLTA